MKSKLSILKSVLYWEMRALFVLGLAGCSETLKNVTPVVMQRNPSSLYRFTVKCNILEEKVVPGTFAPFLVIDGEKHALKQDMAMPTFYYFDYPLKDDRTEAKYYFELFYQQNNRGRLKSHVVKTPLASVKMQECCCYCLDVERAPVGTEVKILGRGFKRGDQVIVGESNAQTTLVSDNVLMFKVPSVIGGKMYPVYCICNTEKHFIGNLLVDNSRFSIEPDSIVLNQGETVDFTVSVSVPIDTDLYVNITTDVPNSVIMPEMVIKAGEVSATVKIEGGDKGKGNLFVTARGFDEQKVSVDVNEDEDDTNDGDVNDEDNEED